MWAKFISHYCGELGRLLWNLFLSSERVTQATLEFISHYCGELGRAGCFGIYFSRLNGLGRLLWNLFLTTVASWAVCFGIPEDGIRTVSMGHVSLFLLGDIIAVIFKNNIYAIDYNWVDILLCIFQITKFDQSGARSLIHYGGAEFPWPVIQSASPLMLGFSSGGRGPGAVGGAGFLINVTYISRGWHLVTELKINITYHKFHDISTTRKVRPSAKWSYLNLLLYILLTQLTVVTTTVYPVYPVNCCHHYCISCSPS